jgi:hypothetical protein
MIPLKAVFVISVLISGLIFTPSYSFAQSNQDDNPLSSLFDFLRQIFSFEDENTNDVVEFRQATVLSTSSTTSTVLSFSSSSVVSSSSTTTTQNKAITFDIFETNDGIIPLENPFVTSNDPQCDPVTLVGGDVNNNGILDPGETWHYTCNFTAAEVGIFNLIFTGFGTDVADNNKVITYPDDPDERITSSVEVVLDSDGDGVPDDSDLCEGHDDSVDSDKDGTPDGCDETPNGDNLPPTANAGNKQTVLEFAKVTLDGSSSTDTDGEIVLFEWSQDEGPKVTLSSLNAISPTFIAPNVDSNVKLIFNLKVTDDDNATDNAKVSVTVKDVEDDDDDNDDGNDDGNDDDGEKVTICHIPPGNPANAHTITVGESAVLTHMVKHGDTIGPCSDDPVDEDSSNEKSHDENKKEKDDEDSGKGNNNDDEEKSNSGKGNNNDDEEKSNSGKGNNDDDDDRKGNSGKGNNNDDEEKSNSGKGNNNKNKDD